MYSPDMQGCMKFHISPQGKMISRPFGKLFKRGVRKDKKKR
jgi:hypothetical protein